MFSHIDGLGLCLEEALADSVLEWRDEFTAKHRVVDVIAEEIEEINTYLMLRPGGWSTLSVVVNGRHHANRSSYFFRFKRAGNGTWDRTHDSLNGQ